MIVLQNYYKTITKILRKNYKVNFCIYKKNHLVIKYDYFLKICIIVYKRGKFTEIEEDRQEVCNFSRSDQKHKYNKCNIDSCSSIVIFKC